MSKSIAESRFKKMGGIKYSLNLGGLISCKKEEMGTVEKVYLFLYKLHKLLFSLKIRKLKKYLKKFLQFFLKKLTSTPFYLL